MSEILLTQLPITYFDSISFETNGAISQIKMPNAEHQLVIILKNIVTFNMRKNHSNSDDEDWIDVIEIIHEYRTLTESELRQYWISFENIDCLLPLHIINIYGNVLVDVLCEKIEIE